MDSGAGLAPRPLKTQNHTTAGKISFTEGDIFYTLGQQLQGKRSFDCTDDVQMFTALTGQFSHHCGYLDAAVSLTSVWSFFSH